MSWDTPYRLLRHELVQRYDEGCVVPASLRARIDALDSNDPYSAAVEALNDELVALPDDEELRAREPNDLDAIRALRPDGPRDLAWSPGDEEAIDRFHGAWTGRAVGCALGKPVEGMGMSRDGSGNVIGRARI